jgi:PrtD family type I secretion system ABC transporter
VAAAGAGDEDKLNKPVFPASAAHPDVTGALHDCRRAFWSVALFSAVVNVLMLAGPLYMLQVYDRVLSSRSVPTLIALTVFLFGAYAFQAGLDIIRSRIVVRAARLLDRRLETSVHGAVLHFAIYSHNKAEAQQPIRDLDQLRGFLTSAGPTAIVDMPWMPVFLILCFLIHPWLGCVALIGGALLIGITALNEHASRIPARAAANDAALRAAMMEADRRNAESARAMGMGVALANRWAKINDRYIRAQGHASDVVSTYGSISKVVRLVSQSAILGLGAYLVIRQELTAGSMIAASIMMGRALAPVEIAIANWRVFITARQSIQRLSTMLGRMPAAAVATVLPPPVHTLHVENVVVAPPASQTIIVRDVHFKLKAGEVLGIVGPNGAGKTSLIRTLVGIWRPARGEVRIDGAPFDQWGQDYIGRYIGFASQTSELFEGSIAENIARMSTAPDNEAVLRAARTAGIHDMVLRQPNGYDTRIGEGGMVLSAGQRERVAIARAIYGEPFLVVFDEPNGTLDHEGEMALQQTVRELKERGAIVIIVAHRPSALANCDKVLYVSNGAQQAFGPRDEILQRILARPVQPAAPAGGLKVVHEAASGAG